jgi:hypothetical protein
MSMELKASYNERVAYFAANDQQHDLPVIDLYIIQHTEVADTQFEFSKRIRAKSRDRFGFRHRLMAQSREYGRFDDSLLTR